MENMLAFLRISGSLMTLPLCSTNLGTLLDLKWWRSAFKKSAFFCFFRLLIYFMEGIEKDLENLLCFYSI